MKKIRCAIYTRKSAEEGLEQEFNSLDAQREACAAYVASQKAEGWVLLPTVYEDAGLSGGTLERPGLQRLLADIDAGLVDQIVVYKVDRLTRSLSDFAKLVERLEAAGALFVSVTQSFNTATSMGRLTLHMLLSFAQFEREVTAERIRDKVAASKRKGLWMGGRVPLGYEKDERTLRINEAEAETVRTLYALYRKHGTLRQVKAEADRLRLRTKQRFTAPVERGDPAAHIDFVDKEGRGEMTNSPMTRQDLRRRIYVKAKAETSWRFCSAKASAGKRWSRRWIYETLGLFSDYRVRYLASSSTVAPAGSELLY